MDKYLFICYVSDPEEDSTETENTALNSHEFVQYLAGFINYSDIFKVGHTYLFNSLFDEETLVINFLVEAASFLDDPAELNSDADLEDEEELDEVEKLIRETQAEVKEDKFSYEEDYAPLYIHFVSSYELAEFYYQEVLGNTEFTDVETHIYTVSYEEQMNLMKKIQNPEDEQDQIQKAFMSAGERRKFLLEGLIGQRKN